MRARLVSSSLDFVVLKVLSLSSGLHPTCARCLQEFWKCSWGPTGLGCGGSTKPRSRRSREFQEALGNLPGTAGHRAYLCTSYLCFPRGPALSLQSPLEMHLPQGWKCRSKLREGRQKKGCWRQRTIRAWMGRQAARAPTRPACLLPAPRTPGEVAGGGGETG